MHRVTRKRLLLGGLTAVVLAGLVYAFLPQPIPVSTAVVRRGPLQQVVEQEGKTEVVNRYAISAPAVAFVERIAVQAGDSVARGQILARLQPPRSPLLDPRAQQQAAARVEAARAALAQADAAAGNATVERARTERLAAAGSATPQARDQARAAAAEASARVLAARADLQEAEAALRRLAGGGAQAPEQILIAPVTGRVLAVRRRSEGQVNPGDTLVVVGNTGQLQIRADVLSDDAVRIHAGTPVSVEEWGGDQPLSAIVRKVEPQGFTAVSSLGVEEQRVPVIADLVSPPALWEGRLGDGFRVLARFVVWASPDALQLPTSALFRVGNGWAVFAVEHDRARLRRVTVGHQAGLTSEILAGLRPGQQVVVHPGNDVQDGVRVRPTPDR